MRLLIGATLALAAAASFAVAAPRALTPSGGVDMVFAQTSLDGAAASVASKCMDARWPVVSQSANQVVCEIPMGAFQSALAQALVGNSYSTTPRRLVRFNLVQTGAHARAQTYVWLETQMAFGQIRQEPINAEPLNDQLMMFLQYAGAQFPVGTTFPGSPYLGVDFREAVRGVGSKKTSTEVVASVVSGGPAERAGIKADDVVIELNGKSFKNQVVFVAALKKVPIGSTITLTVERAGAVQTVSLPSELRPPITNLVLQVGTPGQPLAAPAAVTGDWTKDIGS